jgi:hypothetical protein
LAASSSTIARRIPTGGNLVPSIQELIGDVRAGEILLPEFQRGYVWNGDQVRGLVQSLYRKHPTGHFLIWKTSHPTKVRGGEVSQDGHSLLLLDGQQRLTSLFVLFEGKAPPFYEGESLFFNLFFNMQTSEFRFWQKSMMEGSPDWISVHAFLKESLNAYLERLPQLGEAERTLVQANLARLAQLDAIRNYTYQIDQLSGEDLTTEQVVDIFNRVNSAGTPLTKADLATAHICSLWPQARAELRKFSSEMAVHRFGIDLDFLVRSIAGVASGSVLLEGSFYRVPIEDLQTAWKKVRTSFEHLVNVLRHDAYVDTISDLPTRNVLIPMTVYLARHGSAFTDETVQRKFIRWMFLAGLWGRYSGSAETTLQKDVSLLDADDPTAQLVERIIDQRGRIRLEARDLADRSALSAYYKFSYIVARAKGAKDWFTGLTLYKQAVGTSNGLESHHVFPKAVLTKAGYSPSKDKVLVNQVANRAFLTQKANRKISSTPPVEYMKEIQANHPGALQAQSIPMNQDLWVTDRYEDFLAQRCRLLAAAMNDFLDSLVPDEVAKKDMALQIPELIKRGESVQLEFKRSLRWDYQQTIKNKAVERVIAKTVAGFANAKGGTLLIGIDDDGNVLGLEPDYQSLGKPNRDGFELQVTQVLSSALGESVLAFVTVTFHEIDGKDVCQIVAEPSDHPVYLTDGGQQALYVRMGNLTKALPVDEAVKYVGGHWS